MRNNGNVPIGQIGTSMAYYAGSLYVYGINLNLKANCLYRFDLDNEVWEIESVSSTGVILAFHISYVYNDELFVFFGIDRYSSKAFNFIQKYSFKDRSWMSFNRSEDFRVLHSSIQNDKNVYFLFGQSQNSVENSITKFVIGDEIIKEIIV